MCTIPNAYVVLLRQKSGEECKVIVITPGLDTLMTAIILLRVCHPGFDIASITDWRAEEAKMHVGSAWTNEADEVWVDEAREMQRGSNRKND